MVDHNEKPPISELLEHYGAHFIPTGHRWRALKCPFHEDRTASASVNTEQERFRCFVCGVSGDAYELVMWREGITNFPSAIQFIEELLGRSYGEVLPESQGRRKRRGVFEESGPVRGQRSIFQARSRRRPFTGT